MMENGIKEGLMVILIILLAGLIGMIYGCSPKKAFKDKCDIKCEEKTAIWLRSEGRVKCFCQDGYKWLDAGLER